jgi:hypothetical protein
VAPFIIADETGRDERVPRQRTHANGVTGVGTVTVAVGDVPTVRRWYADILGTPGRDVERTDLQASGARFTVGPATLDFVAPKTGAGPLADWLHTRGPSPYAATLKTRAGPKGPLDLKHTHGARLSFE